MGFDRLTLVNSMFARSDYAEIVIVVENLGVMKQAVLDIFCAIRYFAMCISKRVLFCAIHAMVRDDLVSPTKKSFIYYNCYAGMVNELDNTPYNIDQQSYIRYVHNE
jgi:hypothetical protein